VAATLGATDTDTPASKVEFFTGSVVSAKEKAISEQKQYFLEFYADWCKPCKWMDENTYSNSNLADYINDNYIAVKVNIDDFDGHALKQKYNVAYLPTIIIFDEHGNILGKHEKSMNASKLLKTLKSHRKSTATVKPTKNSSGKSSRTAKASKPVNSKSNPRPSSFTNHEGSPLYSIQVGVYKNANNVFNQVERLKYKFDAPVQVINHKDPSKGIVMYRIVVGKFYSQQAAEEYLKTVKSNGVDGFVKDITGLKTEN
jgi:thioredoxin-related protein